MVEAIAFIRKIMSRLTADGDAEEIWPGPNVSDAALREWIMNEAWGHHASCSCKLGATDDGTAVLDKDFRVRGTTNLRVVDASVFPYIPRIFHRDADLHDRGEGKRGDFSGCEAIFDLIRLWPGAARS